LKISSDIASIIGSVWSIRCSTVERLSPLDRRAREELLDFSALSFGTAFAKSEPRAIA
jgi:hypothetical protein